MHGKVSFGQIFVVNLYPFYRGFLMLKQLISYTFIYIVLTPFIG
jgi:hypothetical protein